MRAVLLSAVLLAAFVPSAQSEELPDSVRRMAERAFLEGRLHDLDDILAAAKAPVDRLPLILRDEWWRTARPKPERAAPADDSLTARRLRWIDVPGGAAWPVPPLVGEDPYPIITALVQDRLWRESKGHVGLPQQGPLEAVATHLDERRQKREIWFLTEGSTRMMSVAYRGVPPHEARVDAEKRAEDLRARNGTWAVVTLLAFLLAPLLLVRVLGRRSLEP